MLSMFHYYLYRFEHVNQRLLSNHNRCNHSTYTSIIIPCSIMTFTTFIQGQIDK